MIKDPYKTQTKIWLKIHIKLKLIDMNKVPYKTQTQRYE